MEENAPVPGKLTYVTAMILPREARTARSLDLYFEEFQKLVDSGVPIVLFLDRALEDRTPRAPNVRVEHVEMRDIWFDRVKLPRERTPSKDTADYMSIQLCKLRFLKEAVCKTPYRAWIDFGVFHMFTDVPAMQAKLRGLCTRDWEADTILAPGWWKKKPHKIWTYVCWRFNGSFLLGTQELFARAHEEQSRLVRENLPRLTWEVNYWTLMEQYFTVYFAYHNDTLLDIPADPSLPTTGWVEGGSVRESFFKRIKKRLRLRK